MVFAEFIQAIEQQALLLVIALSRIDFERERILVLLRFVCTSPLAVSTTVEILDLRKVSNSSEQKSLLLIMCIDVSESTSNSRSSGLFEVGADITVASIGE